MSASDAPEIVAIVMPTAAESESDVHSPAGERSTELADTEAYILLLLADGNLPTGSFVASSGFESFIKHGFTSPSIPAGSSSTSARALSETTIFFVRNSLASYARSALGFVKDAHEVVATYVQLLRDSREDVPKGDMLARLAALDQLYEAMTLNHVARRASTTQGIALLTLYTKGFSRPYGIDLEAAPDQRVHDSLEDLAIELKLMIRRGQLNGHLPICWGFLTGALGLSSIRSQHLHLFLHARSLLSASVRLNTIGPYASQQLLLHAVRPLVEKEMNRCKDLTAGISGNKDDLLTLEDDDDCRPATTWPLGEILATRHDLQHSRIFNS